MVRGYDRYRSTLILNDYRPKVHVFQTNVCIAISLTFAMKIEHLSSSVPPFLKLCLNVLSHKDENPLQFLNADITETRYLMIFLILLKNI